MLVGKTFPTCLKVVLYLLNHLTKICSKLPYSLLITSFQLAHKTRIKAQLSLAEPEHAIMSWQDFLRIQQAMLHV